MKKSEIDLSNSLAELAQCLSGRQLSSQLIENIEKKIMQEGGPMKSLLTYPILATIVRTFLNDFTKILYLTLAQFHDIQTPDDKNFDRPISLTYNHDLSDLTYAIGLNIRTTLAYFNSIVELIRNETPERKMIKQLQRKCQDDVMFLRYVIKKTR